ncbi:hypothetical protein KIP88_39065 [Bradyrhizobium sp. SRL28]|uniref:hypothetical protein n=1 Tax=Bradyrhizobium sp. SRL28 TaxID=2836178 RepID=UPI001BDE6010|nr:hypothetical protein [Bradyrhizobium sp. SRL28]MBT1516440.1 hypothetical protein [Bradyrhizobium sp. SRL28]
MADKGWQRKIEHPIPLSGGQKLITLRDAADYITTLPKKESDLAGDGSTVPGATNNRRGRCYGEASSRWKKRYQINGIGRKVGGPNPSASTASMLPNTSAPSCGDCGAPDDHPWQRLHDPPLP